MPMHNSASRQRYSFANQGTATAANTTGASVGKHVLKRMAGIELWGPSWAEHTIIRIFPPVDQSDRSKFEPGRRSTKHCDFGDWIRVYEAVRNFGSPGVTMLLHDSMHSTYESQLMNPCWILYRSINQALAQGQGLPEWVPLTKGSTGKSAVLSKPSKLFLVQCAIYRHKSKDTFAPGRPPLGAANDGPTIVMGLPPTAGEELVRLMEEREEDWKGAHDDPAQYKYGDPTDIATGKFVHIYELGKDPRAKAALRGPNSAAAIFSTASNSNQPSRGWGKDNNDAKGYGLYMTDTLDGAANDIPASLTGYESIVRSKWKDWDTILEFKSDQDQAHLIAPLFPPSAILYAWRDHSAWIPDNVRDTASFNERKPVSSSSGPSINPMANNWAPRPSTAPSVPNYSAPQSQVGNEDETENAWGQDQSTTPSPTSPVSDLGDDENIRVQVARKKLESAISRKQAKV